MTAETPLFSVLIANYNNASYIEEAVNSVVKQSCKDWEIIIVDDASTDNSIDVIEQLANNIPQIKFYKNDKNYGCGYTKQRCIEEAKGDICGFLDPDDALESNALELMMQEHAKHPTYSLIYSNCYYCSADMKNKRLVKGRPLPIGIGYLQHAWKYPTAGHFATFKRKLFNQSSGIDKSLKRAVDQDLYLKCEEVGAFHYIDETLYNYRIHDKGISTLGNRRKALAWHIKVIIKACDRRGIDFEPILTSVLNNVFYSSKEYQLGNSIIKPLKRLIRGSV